MYNIGVEIENLMKQSKELKKDVERTKPNYEAIDRFVKKQSKECEKNLRELGIF